MPLAVVVLSVAHVIVFNKIWPSAATPGATWVIAAIEQKEPTMLVGQQVGPVRSPAESVVPNLLERRFG
ncbi:MAG: hypothetical protein V1790_09500 [Planctomycetota bacterium]